MPLSTPFKAPAIPTTDVLSLLFDKPATGFPIDRVIFKGAQASASPLSYRNLRTSMRKIGFNLQQKAQVRKGDRVGILSLHGTHYPCLLFGVLCAGAQVVPMNPMLLTNDVINYIKVTGLKTIIVDDMFYKTIEGVLPHYPGLTVIVRGRVPPSKSGKPHMSFDELLGGSSELAWPRGPAVNKSTAFICFSSGTGGLPKAVTLTHENIVANQHMFYYAAQHARHMHEGKLHNIIVSAFPPFHAAGIWGSMIDPAYAGATSVLMPSFTLPLFLQLVKENKPTDLGLAPPIVLLLTTSPAVEGYDFSSVERLNVGAAPLSKELADACVARLNPKARLRQVWGMTELVCCATTFCMLDDSAAKARPGAVGFPLPGLEMKLVNPENGEEIHPAAQIDPVQESQRGEILVRGPSVFAGYLGMPKAEMAQYFTDDGFYRTGDIGVADQQGCIWIVDRIKELIKSSGFQVAPAEVEGILLSHADIVDCAVVGVPDRRKQGTSEKVRAYIVLRPGSDLKQMDPELCKRKIKAWYNPQVMGYKRLVGGIRFVDAIEKSPSGKILRRLLRDQIALEEAAKAQAKL
ncbi:hypothetical protein BCR37DRAFT_346574 [Protomyces lactucae-debilis]|uniref:Acetyl-CoA synthetase-like protein n=1 Tax=Protomyces lactucae-debilis TaxID=2754530 RepID=A0A1Y2FGT4_PROLT|nr:uncharacterized protein BCR37DRAFT_346574 [Protomyces lactucae-debilis]ORY83158.1 hypothetical protein BCR37DRAFT_346574 [Protomyces lactucae-debilis]